MGRGKGQHKEWPKTRDILPWLWQRPWNMLRVKKSPWRFMKAAHYYYFAVISLPPHKPRGPFTFSERPTRWNLTLEWEELNISGGLRFSEEGGGLYAEGPHNTATTPCCSQLCEPIFSKNLLTTSKYHLCPIPTHHVSGFDSQVSSHWIIVLIKDPGWVEKTKRQVRGRQVLNCLGLLNANICTYFSETESSWSGYKPLLLLPNPEFPHSLTSIAAEFIRMITASIWVDGILIENVQLYWNFLLLAFQKTRDDEVDGATNVANF